MGLAHARTNNTIQQVPPGSNRSRPASRSPLRDTSNVPLADVSFSTCNSILQNLLLCPFTYRTLEWRLSSWTQQTLSCQLNSLSRPSMTRGWRKDSTLRCWIFTRKENLLRLSAMSCSNTKHSQGPATTTLWHSSVWINIHSWRIK